MSICNIIKFVEGLENIEEIDKILEAALNQRRKMYPDWDMTYIALPKNNLEQRRAMIKYTMDLLMKENWMGVNHEL